MSRQKTRSEQQNTDIRKKAPVTVYRGLFVNGAADYRRRRSSCPELKTNRGLLKLILLNFLTLGIYGLVVMSNISSDINLIAGRYDGRKTMHYCLVLFIFSWLTLGIYPVIWTHQLCSRIGNELRRRGIAYDFDASTFWLWGVLGSLIVVGPFIYTHKLLKAMNLLAANYNIRG